MIDEMIPNGKSHDDVAFFNSSIAVAYFSSPSCSVCVDLKPRLRAEMSTRFPAVHWKEVNVSTHMEQAAQSRVMTIPAVIVYAEGREHRRFVRTFGVHEVLDVIARLNDLMD